MRNVPLNEGLANFSLKNQIINIWLCDPSGLCDNYSVLPMQLKSGPRQYVNE